MPKILNNLDDVRFTQHGRQRMAERGITVNQVLDALASGNFVARAGGAAECRGATGVVVRVQLEPLVVLTVLPRQDRASRSLRDSGVSRHRSTRRPRSGRK